MKVLVEQKKQREEEYESKGEWYHAIMTLRAHCENQGMNIRITGNHVAIDNYKGDKKMVKIGHVFELKQFFVGKR